ncbi:MAG: MFS transporter [Gaiellaceae bacterium]
MHFRRPKRNREGGAERPASRRFLLPVVLVAQFMVIIDISAVNIALPDLAKDLRIGGADISWTITSYSLLFGSLLLLGGRAADLLGRRRLFLSGLTVFTAASLASALAGGTGVLFAARAAQGLGAAMLSPAALSIVTNAFQGAERTKALAAWGVAGGAGGAVGMILGGALTELFGWQAIFLINLPVAVAVAAAGVRVLPQDDRRPQWRGLDLRGALLATGSLAALVFSITQASTAGWGSAQTLGLASAGLLGLTAFAALERRTAQPLLRVERLADRAIGGGFALMLVTSAVLFGTFLLTSLFLQDVLGTSALQTGLAFLPLGLTTGLGAHLGGRLINNVGIRITMAAGFAVAAAGTLLLSGVDPGTSYLTDMVPGMLIAGVGLGFALVSAGVAILTGARPEESGMLSGLSTTGHEVGGALGVAVLVTIASAAGALGHVSAAGIGDAFLAAALLAAVGSLAAALVLPPARTFLPKLRLSPSPMPVH